MADSTLDGQVRVSEDIVVREIDGELVLLDLASGQYFGLDPVGTRVWQLLAENPSLGDAFDRLLDEFDVDAATLQQDLLTLVDALAANGLVAPREP